MTALTHRRTVRIEWGDCDPAGIVFYPRYFAMFDASAQELFRAALGKPKIAWTKEYGIIGIPMVDTRAKFIIPSQFGDDIVIETRVSEFRRSSFDVVHSVFRPEGLAIEAWETRVWAGPAPDRPSGIKGYAIPEAVIAAFNKK